MSTNPISIEIPIWTKGINFKAFKLNREIKFEDLLTNMESRKGNYEKRIDGWLTEDPYFPQFKTNDNLAYFIYMHFERDGNASRVQRADIWRHYPVGCAIDLKNKLVIVSTADRSALRGRIKEKMLEPINRLTNISEYDYNGDFLFWLAYIFDKMHGTINNRLSVKDLKAITSDQEKINRSNAASANTGVTEYTETKVILGLNGFATGIRLNMNLNEIAYEFNLYQDGRINARKGNDLEDIKDKTLYAIDIHDIIQVSYSEYAKFIEKSNWDQYKKKYRFDILDEAVAKIKAEISSNQ